ncbi:hypothetical protein IV203_015407 [Nitzschia inconspicua]|uniref:Uncharacterized protein n=1 Tax=Nitzschia inconspicua TaxID=303405 RepID=A0A9K3LC51_9STRA|nr:hypothetical protein IV203_015407 [Nitzschia inconspicua]
MHSPPPSMVSPGSGLQLSVRGLFVEVERDLKNEIALTKFVANTNDWTQAIGSGFRTNQSKSQTPLPSPLMQK